MGFTPPTHVVAAFLEALDLYEKEGGLKARKNVMRRIVTL